jgi:hypothetical protein
MTFRILIFLAIKKLVANLDLIKNTLGQMIKRKISGEKQEMTIKKKKPTMLKF